MINDRYITKAELSRIAKVSKAAVSKAVKDGRLPTVLYSGKDLIDIKDLIVKGFIESGKKRSSSSLKENNPKVKQEKLSPSKPKRKLSGESVSEETPPPHQKNDTEETNSQFDIRSKLDLEKLEKLRIENKKARQELIPRELIKKVLSEYFQIDQAQTLQLEHTLSGRICNEIFEDFFKSLSEEKRSERIRGVAKIINQSTFKIQEHKKKLITTKINELYKSNIN